MMKSRRERGNTHIQLQQQQQLQPVQKSCSLCNSCCLCNRTAHQNQPNGMGGKIEKNHCFLISSKSYTSCFSEKNTYTTLFTNKYPYCAKVSSDSYVHVHLTVYLLCLFWMIFLILYRNAAYYYSFLSPQNLF
jgi:hypothetical protein